MMGKVAKKANPVSAYVEALDRIESAQSPGMGRNIAGVGWLERQLKSAEAVAEVEQGFKLALKRFTAESRKDKDAFNRYCNALRDCLQEHPAAVDLTEQARCALVGRYFNAGIKGKRRAGRPVAMHPNGFPIKPLLEHLCKAIAAERGIQGGVTASQARVATRIPAKEIAARCAKNHGIALSPEQVRDILRK